MKGSDIKASLEPRGGNITRYNEGWAETKFRIGIFTQNSSKGNFADA